MYYWLSVFLTLDPWSYLGENTVSDDAALQELGAGAYAVIIKIALVGVAISLLLAYLKLTSSNAHKREEGKEQVTSKFITGIVVCGAVGFINLLFYIFSHLG